MVQRIDPTKLPNSSQKQVVASPAAKPVRSRTLRPRKGKENDLADAHINGNKLKSVDPKVAKRETQPKNKKKTSDKSEELSDLIEIRKTSEADLCTIEKSSSKDELKEAPVKTKRSAIKINDEGSKTQTTRTTRKSKIQEAASGQLAMTLATEPEKSASVAKWVTTRKRSVKTSQTESKLCKIPDDQQSAGQGPKIVKPVVDVAKPSSKVGLSVYIKPLRMIIEDPMEEEEDPYSFNMSQNENHAKNNVKKCAKPRKKGLKPGNKIELLMQRQKLDAVGNSCNVQHNLQRYKAECENLQKQIDVKVPQVTKETAKLNLPGKATNNLIQNNFLATPKAKSLNEPQAAGPKVSYTKVWHSPIAPNPRLSENLVEPFVSGSPPIRSKHALAMAQIAQSNRHSANLSTPFRVTGNLPSAFYMGLSNDDGTPSFSSDVVERNTNRNEVEKNNLGSSNLNSKSDLRALKITSKSDLGSTLGDSNAENVAPSDVRQVSSKSPASKALRTPLKSLDPKSYESQTIEDNVTKRKKTDSLSKSDASGKEAPDHDSFGFDELIEQDCPSSPKAGPSMSRRDYREKLKDFKQYLPSKNYKNRDKYTFPTSPVKHKNLMASPTKVATRSISKFLASSTPLVRNPKTSKIQFGDTSAIASSKSETSNNVTGSRDELFNEDSEIRDVNICICLFVFPMLTFCILDPSQLFKATTMPSVFANYRRTG